MKCVYTILFLLTLSCVVIKNPPYGHAYGNKHKYIFWYYPEYEIYYNTKTKMYFIFKDNKWIEVQKPPYILKTYVIIESDDDKPYLKHHIFKEKYKPKSKKK